MRQLELNEKISIKGKLAAKGVLASTLVGLNTSEAVRLYWASYGKPVAMHSTPKQWRHRTPKQGMRRAH